MTKLTLAKIIFAVRLVFKNESESIINELKAIIIK